jgi:hypothetical protein
LLDAVFLADSPTIRPDPSLGHSTGGRVGWNVVTTYDKWMADVRLDRFWRNARTHSLHDPARWRQFFVGDFRLNGKLSADLEAKFS